MDDYIDYYYETAMEAERDYNDFIEAALELHGELKEMDNIVWKNYRELLLWSRNLRSSAGKELWRKYEKWNDEFQKLPVFVKIVEHDDYWEVFIPTKIAEVKQSEIFNTIAHFCGSPIWKGIDFGELDSPMKFDDFIKNFEQDGWEALHGQLERYSLRIWEDVYYAIDDVQQVCNKLDALGKSEQTFEDCRNRVFGL